LFQQECSCDPDRFRNKAIFSPVTAILRSNTIDVPPGSSTQVMLREKWRHILLLLFSIERTTVCGGEMARLPSLALAR